MTPPLSTHSPRRQPRRLPILLTERDYDILAELLDSRLLTLAQLADIHFDGKREAAKKRLHALKHARLIAGRPRLTRAEPEPLRITHDGFDWLAESGRLGETPRLTWNVMSRRLKVSPLTLRHELSVGAVKAAMHRAVRATPDAQICQFVTWPRLLRFNVKAERFNEQVVVAPDGYFRIEQSSAGGVTSFDFFLEVDRSTETLGRLVNRAAGYLSYYVQGGYARRRGGAEAAPRAFPFRTLWTFPSRARLEGFAKMCHEHRPPILKMMWLATFNDALRDPLGPIWIRPADPAESTLMKILKT